MGKSNAEDISDFFEYAKAFAKAESALKIDVWFLVTIERRSKSGEREILHTYRIRRCNLQRQTWIINWRVARYQCQYPRDRIDAVYSSYDNRSGLSYGFKSCLQSLASTKTQVTIMERRINEYIKRMKGTLFFNEETDENLVKYREKMERKKYNVKAAEERLKQLVVKHQQSMQS